MCASGVRITTRIIDFGDPRDVELKRAVESVKRKLPTGSFMSDEEYEDLQEWGLPDWVPGVFRVKVTLMDIDPPIWRRLLLPQDCTFWDLHVAIQDFLTGENGVGAVVDQLVAKFDLIAVAGKFADARRTFALIRHGIDRGRIPGERRVFLLFGIH